MSTNVGRSASSWEAREEFGRQVAGASEGGALSQSRMKAQRAKGSETMLYTSSGLGDVMGRAGCKTWAAREIVRSRMAGAASLTVPLDVQLGHGANWDAAAH